MTKMNFDEDEKECPYEKQTKTLDAFINYMFPPVENKPGYVWINKHSHEIATVDLVKEKIRSLINNEYEEYCKKDKYPLKGK